MNAILFNAKEQFARKHAHPLSIGFAIATKCSRPLAARQMKYFNEEIDLRASDQEPQSGTA